MELLGRAPGCREIETLGPSYRLRVRLLRSTLSKNDQAEAAALMQVLDKFEEGV